MKNIEEAVKSLHAHLTSQGWPKWLTAVGYKQVEEDGKPDIVVYAKKIKTTPVIIGEWEGYNVIIKKSGAIRTLNVTTEIKVEGGEANG